MGDQELIQVIYISVAGYKMSEEDLMGILQHARAKNAAKWISGMLIYNEGVFLQVLEGPKAEVEALLDVILGDGRHHDFRVLADGPIAQKEFADWTMGFVDTSGLAQDMDGYADYWDTLNDPQLDQGAAKQIIKQFQQGDWRKYISAS